MRTKLGFVAGVLVGVALVACGSGGKGIGGAFDMATSELRDLFGVDGGGGLDGSPIGDAMSVIEMSSADAHETGIMCTPDVQFCEGNKLYSCTKSGMDALGGYDCTDPGQGGTATNPTLCAMDKCPPGTKGACCRRQKPTCSYAVTQPLASSGDAWTNTTSGFYCSGSSGCTNKSWTWAKLATTTCGTDGASVFLNITTAAFPFGTTVTLPASGVSLSASNAGLACSTWTGTVQITDGATSTATVNATCSESGKSSLRVVGTFTTNN